MGTPRSTLSVRVTESSKGDGVIMAVTNTTNAEVRIRFPNPYTGIRLYSELDEPVSMNRTFLCWEESDPEVELRPGDSVSAFASLYPFWCDLHGTFLAKCILKVSSQGKNEDVIAEGIVQIALRNEGHDRPFQFSTIPVMKPKLVNVSRYVCILE